MRFFYPSLSLTLATCLGVGDLEAQETRLLVPPSDGTPAAPAPPRVFPHFEVLSSQTHQLQDQKITIQTVAAPDLPLATKAEASQLSVAGLEQYRQSDEFQEFLAARKAESQANPIELILLSATVFRRSHSYLRWWHQGQAYEAWSNIDFNYLGGFAEFQSGEKRYGLIMGLGNATNLKAHREHLPTYPTTLQSEKAPAYILTSGNQKNAEALAGMDALHRLYAAEYEALIAATKTREEAEQARKAEEKANPPQKPDITIQVWPKEGSRQFLNKEKEQKKEAAK